MGVLASEAPADHAPRSIGFFIGDGAHSAGGVGTALVVVRASYLPNTVRCIFHQHVRNPSWMGWGSWEEDTVKCFMDVRVNSYFYGSGPAVLTLIVQDGPGSESSRELSEERLVNSGRAGHEEILFLSPAIDYGFAAFQSLDAIHWRIRLQSDGPPLALHPWREYWLGVSESHRPAVEMTLDVFKQKVAEAYATMLAKTDGKVSDRTGAPTLQSDANKMREFYIDAGAMQDPDGLPAPPPPSCGKVVPSQVENSALMLDCASLLGLKDDLAGTATLNWSVDVAMGEWEGVRIEEGRVVALNLDGEGLTGSVPAGLAELTVLKELRLSGNALSGCVPASLREVEVHDLDELGLPECGG